MGSTRDIFGTADSAQPATPGSYGEAARGYRLPAETRLGRVRLQVSDLGRSLAFYEQVLGLRVLDRDDVRVALVAQSDDRVLIELNEVAGSMPAGGRSRLGLYHYAMLLPDRASLGCFVRHLADAGVRAGAADHLVSEAFYLNDPDGLGIEVYADRPRETWRQVRGELMMATDPIDVESLLAAAGAEQWTGMPSGTVMGHVHLHVGDIDQAAAFYSDALGFDRMVWSYPGALFLAAGGYHHHLGTNTWAGADAKPADAGDAQLIEWTIELPDRASVQAVQQSLIATGHPAEAVADDEVLTVDPWGTHIRVRVAATSQRDVS